MKRIYYEADTSAGTVSDEMVVDDDMTRDELERRIEIAVVHAIRIIKVSPE